VPEVIRSVEPDQGAVGARLAGMAQLFMGALGGDACLAQFGNLAARGKGQQHGAGCDPS